VPALRAYEGKYKTDKKALEAEELFRMSQGDIAEEYDREMQMVP